MSKKVPHCSECSYLRDKGFGECCRRICKHPDYSNPLYGDWRRKVILSTYAATSPRCCPLRGGENV